MKKFGIFILLVSIIAFARFPENGESVNVLLKSGTSQRAKFVGISEDSVMLGGYIKNKYMVIKIPVASFESIKDSSGNELEFIYKDSPVTDSTTSDSASIDTITTATDTTETISINNWENKTVLVPFARRPIDSSFAVHLQGVFYSLLEEERLNPYRPEPGELDGCNEPSCVIRDIRENNAAGAFFGNIVPGQNDSLQIQLTYFSKNAIEPEEATFSVSSKSPLSNSFENAGLHDALQILLGRQVKERIPDTVYKDPTVHYIYVETDPESAILAMAGGEPICQTPCSFASNDTGTVELYAYWDVDEHLWAGTAKVKVVPGDTSKVSMRLKKVIPTVHVITHPSDAEIYPNLDSLTPFTSRLGTSPKTLQTKIPGPASLKIMKEGYRDTTVNFYVMPTEKNRIEIDLTPITVPAEIKAQQEWQNRLMWKKIGLILMGSSIVPLTIGGVFTYMAHKNYEDARDIRDELSKPHIGGGESYMAKKQKNKDLVNKGDQKVKVGIASFGLGAALLATGIIITF